VDPLDQISECDVLLFHEDQDDRPQPTTVVREPVVHSASDVDIANPSPPFGDLDSSPAEDLIVNEGIELPLLLLLLLEYALSIRLAADVVRLLHVPAVEGMVNLVRVRPVLKPIQGGLYRTDKVTHGISVGYDWTRSFDSLLCIHVSW
jgi:hypothetical protein